MWKKDRSRKRKNSSSDGDTCSPSVLTAAAAVLALTGALLFAGSDSPGCNDVSALNYSPQATSDDGSCIGSMYELSGVFEVQTIAGADPNQVPHLLCIEHLPSCSKYQLKRRAVCSS